MSRSKGVIATIVLLLFACFFAYGCGGDDEGATQDQLNQARKDGAKQAKQQARLKQLEREIKQLQNKAKNQSGNASNNSNAGRGDGYYETGSAGGPVETCATGVQVGPNTSCSFAMNVAGEYGSNPGAATISAYSPATGQHYTLSCGPWSSGTVCTGGNNASVYLP